MCQCRLGLLGRRSARRAIRDRAQACARARSWPVRPVRRGRPRRPRGGCLAARSALVRRSTNALGVPMHSESLIHACPARLPSGRDSRIGTGMGVGQRTGRSGGAHPVNRLRSHRRLGCAARSRPVSVPSCAPLGHDPLGTPQEPSGCGPERSRAPTGRPEPKSLTSQGDAARDAF